VGPEEQVTAEQEKPAMPPEPEAGGEPASEVDSLAPAPESPEAGILAPQEAVLDVQPEATSPEEVAVAALAAEKAVEVEDERAWYVIHCYSGYENKVRYNLEQRIETMGMKDKIFDIVIPTIEEIEIKEGKRRNVERRVFPGYLLVQMILTEESWYVVRNTPGVTGFVGMGNVPTPLRPEEVQQILKRMETATPQVRPTYKAGQRVRIIDGPFNEFIGTVSDIDMDRGKVRVLVSFFGRETPVELDFLQVEKA
jgi:transcriptional antiterminator NusG